MNNNVIEPIIAEDMGTEKQEGGITKKAYEFRTLTSTDTFMMFRIIGKIGLNELAQSFDKDTVKALTGATKGAGDATMVGLTVALEMANIILGNLPKCESEIYQLLSNTSNLSVDQVRKLDFVTFTGMVIDFIKKEEFKDFIKVVSESFKK